TARTEPTTAAGGPGARIQRGAETGASGTCGASGLSGMRVQHGTAGHEKKGAGPSRFHAKKCRHEADGSRPGATRVIVQPGPKRGRVTPIFLQEILQAPFGAFGGAGT